MSSDSVAIATENASRLGYKHACVNYLHVASRDYQYQELCESRGERPGLSVLTSLLVSVDVKNY